VLPGLAAEYQAIQYVGNDQGDPSPGQAPASRPQPNGRCGASAGSTQERKAACGAASRRARWGHRGIRHAMTESAPCREAWLVRPAGNNLAQDRYGLSRFQARGSLSPPGKGIKGDGLWAPWDLATARGGKTGRIRDDRNASSVPQGNA